MKKEELYELIKEKQGGYYNPNKVLVRDILHSVELDNKRGWYLLEKLASNGLYEYGVSVDLGWLIPNKKDNTDENKR